MNLICHFLMFILASISLFSSIVEEGLEHISYDEKEKIDIFFDYAIKICHAGYVLYFDSKPVCIISFWIKDPSTAKFRDGWDTYKKHEHFFSYKNYIFDEQEKKLSSKKSLQIYLINKKNFINFVNRHSNIFQKALSKTIDGKNLLQEIENGKHLMDVIDHNEILLGVLLGYGEESSKLYHENQTKNKGNKTSTTSYITITADPTDDIEILPVAFKGSSNSQEARKINKKFNKERKLLWEIYQKKNQDSTRFFLEALCEIGEGSS